MKIVLLTLFIFLSGCTPDHKYKINEYGVYETGCSTANGSYELRVREADPTSFEAIDTDCRSLFAKDKNHVFHNHTIIENADPKTFKYIGKYYFIDRDSV